MTEDEIMNGKAQMAAFSKEYGAFIKTLAHAITYCSQDRNRAAALTAIGKTGIIRINALFADNDLFQRIPENCNSVELEKGLWMLWGCTFFYPRLSMEWHAVYSEMNVLLESLLDGEWFA